MKTILSIIELLGGLERLRERPIKLQVPSFMPLSIEAIGHGPRGGMLISIMHWFEQNGDLMRDPDLEVEIDPESGNWLPISYRQDSLGIFQEAVVAQSSDIRVCKALVDDLIRFMKQWDCDLEEQGFFEAAKFLSNDEIDSGDPSKGE